MLASEWYRTNMATAAVSFIDLLLLPGRVALLEKEFRMLDANVTALRQDVAEIRSDVTDLAARVAAIIAKQAQAIDDEDLAAIKDTHTDLSAVHDALVVIGVPTNPGPVPAP